MQNFQYLIHSTWLRFLMQYRRTALGPLWLVLGPAMFILVLGGLFARVSGRDPAIFIPHLALGVIIWTLIGGFINRSTNVFQRNRAVILQTGIDLRDILFGDIAFTVIQFLHQLIIVVVIMFWFQIPLNLYSFVALLGLVLIVINGFSIGMIFGVIGARYRDLSEIVNALMRIAFLATPIIWMAGDGRGKMIGAYLLLNPFYHFLELVRAPLLGNSIDALSWAITIFLTLVGLGLAVFFYSRYRKLVTLWV